MSNVVTLNVPAPAKPEARFGALVECFADHRRFADDVFWLKENAEVLNILECIGAALPAGALDAHEEFYAQIGKRLGFFPQYYRFLLSMALDLEDLGLPGNDGEALCAQAAATGLDQAELSDLQRAEARRLLARRGVTSAADPTLDDRLRAFIGRAGTFALPNKKAAYELTHIVFYLSEYGRKDPELDADAMQSLEFAGILAFLDLNADLLAEICIALRFAGRRPPEAWEAWLLRETRAFSVEAGEGADIHDDYHMFLVCNWHLHASGHEAFARRFPGERMAFRRAPAASGALREMSECMFRLDEDRSGDWLSMRPHLEDALSEEAHDLLMSAAASSELFDAFFAGFARAPVTGELAG